MLQEVVLGPVEEAGVVPVVPCAEVQEGHHAVEAASATVAEGVGAADFREVVPEGQDPTSSQEAEGEVKQGCPDALSTAFRSQFDTVLIPGDGGASNSVYEHPSLLAI